MKEQSIHDEMKMLESPIRMNTIKLAEAWKALGATMEEAAEAFRCLAITVQGIHD